MKAKTASPRPPPAHTGLSGWPRGGGSPSRAPSEHLQGPRRLALVCAVHAGSPRTDRCPRKGGLRGMWAGRARQLWPEGRLGVWGAGRTSSTLGLMWRSSGTPGSGGLTLSPGAQRYICTCIWSGSRVRGAPAGLGSGARVRGGDLWGQNGEGSRDTPDRCSVRAAALLALLYRGSSGECLAFAVCSCLSQGLSRAGVE